MSALKDLDATVRRFQRLRYDARVVRRTRRATLRVSGPGWDRDGQECQHALVVELQLDGSHWVPVPVEPSAFEQSRSWLVTTTGTLVSRRAVLSAETLDWAFEQLARRKPKPISAADLSAL